ncbi:MAG: DUF2894 domain-containing protein [Gammaproteobacteria bacterium]
MNNPADKRPTLAPALRRFDPVRVAVIESMLRRSVTADQVTWACLQARIEQRMTALQADFANAQTAATRERDQLDNEFPAAGAAATVLLERGDFRGLRQLRRRLENGNRLRPLRELQQAFERSDTDHDPADDAASFEELLRQQEQTAVLAQARGAGVGISDGERSGELRAMRQFREAWAKRVLEKAVAHAMEEAPEDAGPLNAHRLVIQAVSKMQELSPSYLNRFVSYIDTLLWLERRSGAKS